MDCRNCQCRFRIGALSIYVALVFEAVFAGGPMVPPGANPFSVRIVVAVLVTPPQNKKGHVCVFRKRSFTLANIGSCERPESARRRRLESTENRVHW